MGEFCHARISRPRGAISGIYIPDTVGRHDLGSVGFKTHVA